MKTFSSAVLASVVVASGVGCARETKFSDSKTVQKLGPAEVLKGDPLAATGVHTVTCQTLLESTSLGAPKEIQSVALPLNCPVLEPSANPIKSIFVSVALDVGPNMQKGELALAFKTSVENICKISKSLGLPGSEGKPAISWNVVTFDDIVLDTGKSINLCDASERNKLPFKKRLTTVTASTDPSEFSNQILNAGFAAVSEASKHIQSSSSGDASALKLLWYVSNTTSQPELGTQVGAAAKALASAKEAVSTQGGTFSLLASVQDGVLEELPSTYPKPSRQWGVFVSSAGIASTQLALPMSDDQSKTFSDQLTSKNFKQKSCSLTAWKSFGTEGQLLVDRMITGATQTSGFESIPLNLGENSLETTSSCAQFSKTFQIF